MAVASHPHVRGAIKLPEGFKEWVCVYPIYINKDRTLAEGRRVKKSLAIKNPILPELMDVMASTGMQVFGEPNKIHPREKSKEPPFWGRIRVQLKDQDGKPVNEKFQSRDDVYTFLATMIPQLKSRNQPKPNPDEKKKGKGKKK